MIVEISVIKTLSDTIYFLRNLTNDLGAISQLQSDVNVHTSPFKPYIGIIYSLSSGYY